VVVDELVGDDGERVREGGDGGESLVGDGKSDISGGPWWRLCFWSPRTLKARS
jgi:hypothetical protein